MSHYFGTASIVEEGDQGYQYPTFDTYAPPPMVTVEGQPMTPYAAGQTVGTSSPSTGSAIGSGISSLVGGLASIFGIGAQNQYHPAYPPPPAASTTPAWILPVVIGGAVVVGLVVMKSMKRRPAVAGYRRRRSRR